MFTVDCPDEDPPAKDGPILGAMEPSQRKGPHMRVELFHSAGCKRCAAAHEGLRSAAEQAVPGVVWRDIDAVNEIDYALELGVMSLPAVAVDGQLVFSSLPTPAQLTRELQRRAAGASNGR